MSYSSRRTAGTDATFPGLGAQRHEERIPFRAHVQAIPLDGRHQPIIGTTEDICHQGVFISSRTGLPVDSLVVLKLYTSHGKLKLCARVVHNIEGVGFGCQFMDIDQRQRTCLSLLVAVRSSAPVSARTIH